MLVAPYYVIWACMTLFMLWLVLLIVWLVYREAVSRIARRVHYADLAAALLGYGALWHATIARGVPHLWPGAWALGLCAAGYALLRVLPGAAARATAMLGLVLVAWGWSIGAGFQYTQALRADGVLWSAPAPFDPTQAAGQAALHRASLLTRLPAEVRESAARLAAHTEPGGAPAMAELSAFRLQVAPVLARAVERDVAKLTTYLALQVVLLVVLLALWGFGRPPEEEARPWE